MEDEKDDCSVMLLPTEFIIAQIASWSKLWQLHLLIT